jgi:hypothetical protein
VAAAAAGHDADLAGRGRVRPDDVYGIEGNLEDVGVGLGEPGEGFPHHILRVVDQFLHVRSTKMTNELYHPGSPAPAFHMARSVCFACALMAKIASPSAIRHRRRRGEVPLR